MRKIEHILAAVTLVTLIVAWIIGWQKANTNVEEFIHQKNPELSLTVLTDEIYEASNKDYFVIGEANGYGGPMQLLVQFDSLGVVKTIVPLEHKETIAFFQKAEANGLLKTIVDFNCKTNQPDLYETDVISGATFTSNAIINSVRNASNKLAYNQWGIQPKEVPKAPFGFGLKEITLLVLFLVSLLIYNWKFKYKKQVRKISQLLSIVVLGFVTTTMMSIVHINSMLMLYFPKIAVNLAWYFLIFILFAPILLKRKNYYCGTICPFGATQEFLGKVGNAKSRISDNIRKYLIWLPRVLAWGFILLALISNNPGIRNHEIFSAFFRLTGSDYLFAILALVLVLSTFISRPWCNYLCPIRGTTDYVEYWLSLKKK